MRTTRLLPALLFFSLLGAAPAAAADCPGADLPAGSPDTVAVRAAVVCLTNEERASAGLAALVPEGRLEAAAQAYSGQLVGEQFFAHVAPDGGGLTDRLETYANWQRIGENLAWGEGTRGTPRAIVASWMGSPSHRANILTGEFTEVGIGMVPGSPSGSTGPAATYVAEYGSRSSDTPPRPVKGAASGVTARSVTTRVKPARRARKAARRCRGGKVSRRTRVHGRKVVRCMTRAQAKRA